MDLVPSTFEGRVGERFTFAAEGAPPFEVTLVRCDVGPEAPGRRRPFALEFAAGDGPALAQQVVAVRHPELGEEALLVVPVGHEADGLRYEAVIG